MAEYTPQCVLGNGDCPATCPLYDNSAKATDGLGKEFNPNLSRISVVFGDAFSHKVNIVDIANVMSRCVREQAK